MNTFLPLLLTLVVSLPITDDGDLSAVRSVYQESVRDVIGQDSIREADVQPAREAITALVVTGEPQAVDILSVDAAQAAARLLKLHQELEAKKLTVAREKRDLEGKTGQDRSDADGLISENEERIEKITVVLSPLQEIRDALYGGLLDVSDRSAAQNPEDTWTLLVAYFEQDTKHFYELDQKVRQLEARLKTVREKISAETEEEEKDDLERLERKLATALEHQAVQWERCGALKDRRVATLAILHENLPKAMQARELKEIRSKLRDDVPWETRAINAELLGRLSVDESVTELLTVMRRASKTHRDINKDLDPLREKYAKALEALMTSARGGGGTVPSAVLANKNQREAELREVSMKGYGESRVLESASMGLGAALSESSSKNREKDLDAVLKAARKDRDREFRTRALTALGVVDDEEVRDALRDIVLKDSDLRLRLAALDSLARTGDEKTVDMCIDSLLQSSEWRVRAAAIESLVKIPRKRAVPALIQSVSMEVGRLIDDAENALTALTGKSFNADSVLWKKWWEDNGGSFEIGKVGALASDAATGKWEDAPGKVSFYGIQTRSNRILFVIDRSGSMNEPVGVGNTGKGAQKKIDAAKAQLKAAVSALDEGDLYNIISYSEDVGRWQKRMVKMSKKTRSKVDRHILKEIQAGGGTNIHDALQEAFRLAGIGAMDKAYESNVDTIFFLTDGMPTVGEVQEPTEILRRVMEWNRLARIVVHTVGVGKNHDAAFLRRLAEENGGQYVSR